MVQTRRVVLILSILCVAAGSVHAEESDDSGYLSPPDLYKVAEESEHSYAIHTLEDLDGITVEEFAQTFWPAIGESLDFPWISTGEDGGRSLMEYDLGEGCLERLHEGEKFFDAEEYDKALKVYTKAVEEWPGCYVALSHVGDCHYFQGDFAEALDWYEKAIKLNPYDFRGHFYKANTLYRLRWPEEARTSYVQALALRPHRESVVSVLREGATLLGVEVEDRPFAPRALARLEGDEVGVYFPEGKAYWLVYGLCKAVWIAEPTHREARTGSIEHQWSLVEERQCLMSMAENYYALREDDSIEEDPEIERIFEVLDKELIDGFVFYEIAYRLYPQATLLFPDEMFDEVVRYVDAHVLPRTTPAE